MEGPIRIRVRYPAKKTDKLVIRTSLDWERDVEPIAIDDQRTTWVFDLPAARPRPHVYFKACRLSNGVRSWAVGPNRIVWEGERSVYPQFDGGEKGTIGELLTLGSRKIRVYCPPGYSENVLKRYPTLYVHDGANVFFPDEAFLGVEWKLDEALDALDSMNLADEVLVVAVWAKPDLRMAEYTPPGWTAYADDLVRKVKPAIDGRYRTLEGPASTAVMGSSLGGLVSLYLAWEHPDVFGAAACLSSSFGMFPAFVDRLWSEPVRPIRVYLDSGWPGDNFEATREVRDALLARGYAMGRDLLHLAFPGAIHHERAWSERVHLPIQFLFGDAFDRRRPPPPPAIPDLG